MAKALNAESSKYDLGKLENHINSMQTYTSLMEGAGQILVTRKNVREPALLIVPDDILVADDLEIWIEEKLTVNSTRETELMKLVGESLSRQRRARVRMEITEKEAVQFFTII